MNMTVKSTIKKILDARKISRYQLAKELEITPQALEYMLQNNSRGVRVSVLIKLQEVSGLTVSQFWKLLKDEHGALDE
jgi:DNA-binding Xre family transcriptional regulator